MEKRIYIKPVADVCELRCLSAILGGSQPVINMGDSDFMVDEEDMNAGGYNGSWSDIWSGM